MLGSAVMGERLVDHRTWQDGLLVHGCNTGVRCTPLPASPTRGEVPRCGCGNVVPHARWNTLPLVGRDGEGVSQLPGTVIMPPPASAARPAPWSLGGTGAAGSAPKATGIPPRRACR